MIYLQKAGTAAAQAAAVAAADDRFFPPIDSSTHWSDRPNLASATGNVYRGID